MADDIVITPTTVEKSNRNIKTTKNQIAEYWEGIIDECELNFDWSDALEHCWNCGNTTKRAERCHIIPHALGGEDTPSNYVLLCKDCHEDAPDITDPDAMWNWIKSNKNPWGMYDTYNAFKALQLFEQRNGFKFEEKAVLIENALNVILSEIKNVGTHFGMRTKPTSYLYMFEKIIKVHLPNEIKKQNTPQYNYRKGSGNG